MMVQFVIHGVQPTVEGYLNLDDGPVPAVGWQLNFDAVGAMTVDSIEGYYSALGESVVALNLKANGELSTEWIVDFFRLNDDLTAFTDVDTGNWCFCRLCR